MKKQADGVIEQDVFEAARQAFFSGDNGKAAATAPYTFTQVKSYDGPVVERAARKTDPAVVEELEAVGAR